MTLLTAGVVIGIGLGGFIDGIALHQILQWHNMGSAVLPPHSMPAMSQNMRWDGWFHAAALLITLAGVFMLWREGQHGTTPESGVAFAGQMIFGWGLFNLVEGLIDHHMLGLHHVRDLPMHVPLYDWVFLFVAGVGFVTIGAVMLAPRRHAVSA